MGARDMIDTGGEAFPATPNERQDPQHSEYYMGMTLLDWYAGKSNISYKMARDVAKELNDTNEKPTINEILTTRANLKYIEAQAMIAEKRRLEAKNATD